MKRREFGWHIILYNIKRIIKISSNDSQTFFILVFVILSFRTEHFLRKIYKAYF